MREKGLAGSDGAPGLSRKQLEGPDYSVDGHTHTHNPWDTLGLTDFPGGIIKVLPVDINQAHA